MFPEFLKSDTIFAEEKKKCINCETIIDMWPVIGNFFISFSYKILKYLIQKLGTDYDKQCLQEYEKLFIEHSKKSLENYSGALARFTEGTTCTELIFKINQSFKKISAKHLEELKINLAKALDIPNDHLKRFGIQPGCIEITYHVPLYIEFQLKAFAISAEQQTLLKNLRVIWLKCGCFWYYVQVCSSFKALIYRILVKYNYRSWYFSIIIIIIVQNVDGSGPENNHRRPDTGWHF